MALVRKFAFFFFDLLEIYIPVVTFVIMFFAFMLQIITRYVFNNPLTWAFEVSVIAFVWTVILGACYARRKKDMVEFAVVFEMFSEKVQHIFIITGNLIVAVGLIMAIYPVYDYIQFLEIEKSTVLRIPFNIAFFPFMMMIVLMIGHSVHDIIDSIQKIIRLKQTGKPSSPGNAIIERTR